MSFIPVSFGDKNNGFWQLPNSIHNPSPSCPAFHSTSVSWIIFSYFGSFLFEYQDDGLDYPVVNLAIRGTNMAVMVGRSGLQEAESPTEFKWAGHLSF